MPFDPFGLIRQQQEQYGALGNNMRLAQKAKDRRAKMVAEGTMDPLQAAQSEYTGPGWDAFFESLKEKEEAATDAGMRFKVDWSNFGSPSEDYMPRKGNSRVYGALGDYGLQGAGPSFFDIQDAKNRALNEESNDAAMRARELDRWQEQEWNQRQQDLINAQQSSYINQVQASGLQGGGRTMMSATQGTGPVDPYGVAAGTNVKIQQAPLTGRDAMLAALPREKRADMIMQWEKQDAAAPRVFAAPVDAQGVPLTGAALLEKLPATKQNMVKAILDGRQAMPSGTALKDPYWKDLIETANAVDPTYDAINFNSRNQTRTDFTKGKGAGQINAINTVVGHLHDLAGKADKLGNTDLNWVNSVFNALTAGGSERGVALNDFETLKEGVATELMRVWRQVGAGSEKEIEDWKAQIGATKSPQELRSAFGTIGGMLQSKLDALDTQYKQGMGTNDISAISPESRKKLDALQTAVTPARTNPYRQARNFK